MNLTDHFLIAMPQLKDPYFCQSVVYLCEHTSSGAMGVVVNRPMNVTFSELLRYVDVEQQPKHYTDQLVLAGGPVKQEHGFLLHTNESRQWQSSLRVTDELGLTFSKDILQSVAQGEGPSRFLPILGCSGWSAGQLEDEITENVWLCVRADAKILFDTPAEERWQATAEILGVNMYTMPGHAGHA